MAINDKSARGSDDDAVTLERPMNYGTLPTSGQHVAHKAALISKNFVNCVIIFNILLTK